MNDVASALELADYRRQVAAHYREVRDHQNHTPERRWQRFVAARSALLKHHPQSPLDPAQRAEFDGLDYFAYDPEVRVVPIIDDDVDDETFDVLFEDRWPARHDPACQAPGRTLGLVGESGSGKSTLARAIVGLNRPDEGTITVLDVPLARDLSQRDAELLRHLQMVFQSSDEALNPYHTVGHTLRRPFRGRVIFGHVLPNALLPTITVIAISFGWLISGLIVVENVFNYPGLGRLLTFAIDRRDLPLLQAITLVAVLAFAIANLVADFLYAALNPRIKLE